MHDLWRAGAGRQGIEDGTMELTQRSSSETAFVLATDAAPGLGSGRLRQVSFAVCRPGA